MRSKRRWWDCRDSVVSECVKKGICYFKKSNVVIISNIVFYNNLFLRIILLINYYESHFSTKIMDTLH